MASARSNQPFVRVDNAGNAVLVSRERVCQIFLIKSPCTADEIRQAYKNKVLEFHPDKIKQQPKEEQFHFINRQKIAPAMFMQIKEAWEVLKPKPQTGS
jgi:DnaJ-class molecular chaperone